MTLRKSTLNKKTKAAIIDEAIEMSKELDELRKQVAARAARPAAAVKEAEVEAATVTAAVADITPDEAARQVTDISLMVGRAFDNVQTQLMTEVKTLDNVRKAIALAEQRIKDLHGVDIAATSLAELIDEIDTRKAAFEEFIAEAREQYEADVAERDAEAERYEADVADSRAREQADYEYRLHIARREAEDEYKRKCQDDERARLLRFQAEDRDRERRLAELVEAETELTDLRAAVDEFDARLADAVEQARTETKVSVERSAGFKAQLAAKEHEATVALLEAKVEAQAAQLADATTAVHKLQAELAAANERNTNLATQALKSAEGQTALAELRGFATRGDNTTNKRN